MAIAIITAGISKIPWGKRYKKVTNPASLEAIPEIRPINKPLDNNRKTGTTDSKNPRKIEKNAIVTLFKKINLNMPKNPSPSVCANSSSTYSFIISNIGINCSAGAV